LYGQNKDVSPEGGFGKLFGRVLRAKKSLAPRFTNVFLSLFGMTLSFSTVNPEAFFKQQFGGDRFVDIIGEISIGRDMRDALNEPEDESTGDLSPEEKAKREASVTETKDKARDEARQARVDKLVQNLVHKLSIYTDGPCDYNTAKAYQEMVRLEAEELKAESYGVELLHAIGFTYTLKAKQYLGKNEMLGLGSWFHGVREKGHILSETVSTLRAAMDLQQSFTQLQEAEKEEMDEAAKKALEEAAATKGLRALWKGSKLEVEGKNTVLFCLLGFHY